MIMKKLAVALLAASVMVPMLSYAQTPAPARRGDTEAQSEQSHKANSDYGPGIEGSVQSGWTTQPSPQALGQSLYIHH